MTDIAARLAGMNVEARPYQERIIGKTMEFFCAAGLRSVLIEAPCGAGKTVMGLVIARLLQDRLRLRIGWTAMRRNLLAQTAAENAARGIGAELTYFSMFDRDPPADLDMLISDEGHHDGAASMAHLYSVIRPRFVLGLSATPYRTDRVQLCYEKVIRDAGIASLIRDGYLSAYHHFTIPRHSPQSVAECYCREPERWGPTLAYFHTLDQCIEAHRLLQAAGVRSDIVTGKSDREAQLEAFTSGHIDVLLNCVVLTEGFNFPGLKTVFCRPSCRGLTVQMGGRALRKSPEMPHKQIVQCQGTRWPFPRLAPAAGQFIWTTDGWRSLTPPPGLDRLQSRVLQSLASTQSSLPAFLSAAATSNPRRRGRRARRRGASM